jgi:hypothetical protein
LGKVRADITSLVDRWVQGRIPDAAYEANLARYQAAERDVAARLGEVRDATALRLPASEVVGLVGEMLRQWPGLTVEEKNLTLRQVVRRVVVRRRQPGRLPPVSELIEVEFR